jgi:hypothetical protein
MFFLELLASDADKQAYERVCAEFSDFFNECSGCLVMVWQIVHEAAAKTDGEYHANLLALVRHVVESLDGVSILVSQGGSHACQPLLRSAMEASLGVLFILEADSERRALAYAVAHAHKRVKLYKRLDATTQAGREFRKLLDNDVLKEFFNMLPPTNYADRIANLERMLARVPYLDIQTEWKRMKGAHPRGDDPAWFSLFGGPKNVRELAIHLNWTGMYEILYRMWSDEVHAGNALEALGKKEGESVWRPIRHPELLQGAVQHGTTFALVLAKRLIDSYAPDQWPILKARYAEKISSRAAELGQKQVINAPWKDSIL